MAILSIDAGTTGISVLVVNRAGKAIARGYKEFEQHFPQPGWVEHRPEQIWQATLEAVKQALAETPEQPTAIGITNQRETILLWDKTTLETIRPAIVWQDRRTADILSEPKFESARERVLELTGLPLDPYFSSSKLLWVKRNEPQHWAGVTAGRIAVGTVDSYLVARMSGGRHHITDASNASRTQLLNIHTGEWSDELLDLFEVPKVALPRVTASYGQLAETMPEAFLGLSLPITGIAGDQQAALFGQAAFEEGDAKCTYGTGAFLLKNTGKKAQQPENGLLATIAWQKPNGERTYALEGSTFVAGAAVQWLRDGLQLIETAADIEPLAKQVESAEGVLFIPALTGLGAPFWKPEARGEIRGITRGTTKAHIARATLDGIALQVYFVFEAMGELKRLKVDGGASANGLLMQLQADLLQCQIERPAILETTALGAAFLAGLGSGYWESMSEIAELNPTVATFRPATRDEALIEAWRKAVETI